MHHGGIVPGGCAYALDVLCQNTSFTAQLRTERGGLRAPRGKRGSQGRSRRGAQISAQGFHTQVRCTTGGKGNQPIISCVSNGAGRGIRVLDGAATSCEAVAGLQDGPPCLSPGACRNGKTSGGHGTGWVPGLHAQASRAPPPPAARGERLQDCKGGDGSCVFVFFSGSQKISTRRWIPTRCERVWYSKQGTKKLNA